MSRRRAKTQAARQRERVDGAFRRMARDPERRAEDVAIERELGPVSDEAWRRIDD